MFTEVNDQASNHEAYPRTQEVEDEKFTEMITDITDHLVIMNSRNRTAMKNENLMKNYAC